MLVADLNRKRKRKKVRKPSDMHRRSAKDPLHSFDDGAVNLDGLEGDEVGMSMNDEKMSDFGPGETDREDTKRQKRDESFEKKIFANTRDGVGKSTSGRNAWKEKHRKGKYSGKKRMSERRKKDPLGV